MVKIPKKQTITVYDVEGNVVEKIERFVYNFNRGRSVNYGTYWGVNYRNCRPHVYGDNEHPNGLYIYQGDFRRGDHEAMRKKIHANHVFDERVIINVG